MSVYIWHCSAHKRDENENLLIPSFSHEAKTDLCEVLSHTFLKVLWDFQGKGAPLSLPSLLYLLSMVFGMSQGVVVFIQQLQLLDQVT